MKSIFLSIVAIGMLLVAGCASDKQTLYEANQAANVDLARTLNYVSLPDADSAVKTELKVEAAQVNDAFDAAWADISDGTIASAKGAHNTLAATLSSNNINCGAASTDTCP